MKNPSTYTYSVLRYVHDMTSGESVNVGVALCAPRARFVDARCLTNCGRPKKMFPGMNEEHVTTLIAHIQDRITERGAVFASDPAMYFPAGVLDLAESVLPKDDSSLQWSAAGSGITEDPARTLSRLYERMVTRYEDCSSAEF